MDEYTFIVVQESIREVPIHCWRKRERIDALKRVKRKKKSFTLLETSIPQESTAQCQEKPHQPAISSTGKMKIYCMSTWFLEPSRILPKKSTSFLPHLEYWSDRHGWGSEWAGSRVIMAPNHQRAVDLTKWLTEFIKDPTHEPLATPCLHIPSNGPRATSMLCVSHPPHFGQFLMHAPTDVQCEPLQTACKISTESLPSSGELGESKNNLSISGHHLRQNRELTMRCLPLQDEKKAYNFRHAPKGEEEMWNGCIHTKCQKEPKSA